MNNAVGFSHIYVP